MPSVAIGRSMLVMKTFFIGFMLGGSQTAAAHADHHRPSTNAEGATPRTEAALRDQVHDLPGLEYRPKFDMYAGYLDPVASRHVFYWYAESSNDPDNDPVVLWTNGGPGCSGLLGFGTENGPFYIGKEGSPIHHNPYSWNRIANMLYVEIPAGVGFSYTDSPNDKITGDAQTSLDNFNIILEFFKRFPERSKNDFYIASESYGGHYIPQLALDILRRDYDGAVNFKGFMLGNPYVDPYSNEVAQFEAYYSHGLIAKPQFDHWRYTCNDPVYYDSDECQDIIHDMFKSFGHGINPYALDFPVCNEKVELEFHRMLREGHRRHETQSSRRQLKQHHHSHRQHHHRNRRDGDEDEGDTEYTTSSQVNFLLNQTIRDRSQPRYLPVQERYIPCAQVYLEEYLNRHDVRAALHVLDSATYQWKPCGGVKYSEGDITTPVTSLYKELVHRAQHGLSDLKMLIFSGDDDAICSTAGTQQWIWNLGVKARDIWTPWKVLGQTAGFVTHFDLGDKATGSLSFATVHGAGHEVPAYRPQEALDLFHKFLTDDWKSLLHEWYLPNNEESDTL